MDIEITPKRLAGEVDIISSKSYAHRAFICAFLSGYETKIIINNDCEDVLATINCLKALGATVDKTDNGYIIKRNEINKSAILNCNESGSTLRFMSPVCAAYGVDVRFECKEGLKKRPIKEFVDITDIEFDDFHQAGSLKSGVYELRSDLSSQFISGMLMGLAVLKKDSKIILKSTPVSMDYINITIEVLKDFGIEIKKMSDGFFIKGGQKFKNIKEYKVEGDWSNAAFWLCADVKVNGLKQNTRQADRRISDIIKEFENDNLRFDADLIPDLAPIISVYAAIRQKQVVIYNAKRLKIKESDRQKAIFEMINALGGKAEINENEIIIHKQKLMGGCVDSYNDHRIAMAAMIGACYCENKVYVKNVQCINKSYPAFIDEYERLGGCICRL